MKFAICNKKAATTTKLTLPLCIIGALFSVYSNNFIDGLLLLLVFSSPFKRNATNPIIILMNDGIIAFDNYKCFSNSTKCSLFFIHLHLHYMFSIYTFIQYYYYYIEMSKIDWDDCNRETKLQLTYFTETMTFRS